jgi:hypothetical protein
MDYLDAVQNRTQAGCLREAQLPPATYGVAHDNRVTQ